MSRLIDTDAFKDSVAKVASKDLGNISLLTIGKALGQTPTVEAIPIEWLKEWSRLYLAPTKEYTDIIEDIIKDYREEQAQSSEAEGGTEDE